MRVASKKKDRNRIHPRERFSEQELRFNLDELTETIKQEELSEEHLRQGHRQIALIRRRPQTMALYYFEPDGYLSDHQVAGLVSLFVLDGRIRVETDNENHELHDRDLLILNGQIAHRLRAIDETRVLVTINADQHSD